MPYKDPKVRRERGRIAERKYRDSPKGKASIKRRAKRFREYLKVWMRIYRKTSATFQAYEKKYRKDNAAKIWARRRKWLRETPKGLRAFHDLPSNAPDEVLKLAQLMRAIKKEKRRGYK